MDGAQEGSRLLPLSKRKNVKHLCLCSHRFSDRIQRYSDVRYPGVHSSHGLHLKPGLRFSSRYQFFPARSRFLRFHSSFRENLSSPPSTQLHHPSRPFHNQPMFRLVYPLLQITQRPTPLDIHLLLHNRLPQIHLGNDIMNHDPRLRPLPLLKLLPRSFNTPRANQVLMERRMQIDNFHTLLRKRVQKRRSQNSHKARADDNARLIVQNQRDEICIVGVSSGRVLDGCGRVVCGVLFFIGKPGMICCGNVCVLGTSEAIGGFAV